jgi:hypothetical protein
MKETFCTVLVAVFLCFSGDAFAFGQSKFEKEVETAATRNSLLSIKSILQSPN